MVQLSEPISEYQVLQHTSRTTPKAKLSTEVHARLEQLRQRLDGASRYTDEHANIFLLHIDDQLREAYAMMDAGRRYLSGKTMTHLLHMF